MASQNHRITSKAGERAAARGFQALTPCLDLEEILFLVLGLAAACMVNAGEPVSWQVVDVSGKAIQVKEGTKAWHKVTIKNTGGTKAERVELSFRMLGLVEYGDGIAAVYKVDKRT